MSMKKKETVRLREDVGRKVCTHFRCGVYKKHQMSIATCPTHTAITVKIPPYPKRLDSKSYVPTVSDFEFNEMVPYFHEARPELDLLKHEGTVNANLGYGILSYRWIKLTVLQGARCHEYAIAVWQATESQLEQLRRHCQCDYHTASLCRRICLMAPCPCCCGCLQESGHGQTWVVDKTFAYLRNNNIAIITDESQQ